MGGLVAILFLLVAFGLGHNPELVPRTSLVMCAYLLLELLAVNLPLAGRFSAAGGVLCAGAALPEGGARLAVGLVLLSVLLDGLKHQFSSAWARSAGLDLLPSACALGVIVMLPGSWTSAAGGALAYLAAQQIVFRVRLKTTPPGERANLFRIRNAVWPLHLATTAGGLVLLAAPAHQWWLAVLVIPLLAVSHQAAENIVFRLGVRTAVAAVEQSQKRESALRRTRTELKGRVDLLSRLVDSCQELAGDLDAQAVYSRLEKVLRRTIPHEGGAILELRDKRLEVVHWWSSANLSPKDDSLREVAATVAERNGPLEVEDGARSGYPAPFAGVRSMLGFPVTKENKPVGVVLLVDRKVANFSSDQKSLLGVLAVQAGITLDNSRLYRDVLRGRKRLEESQNQLIQAEKMTAIGKLAAGVAHELNTPLAAILLSLEAVEDMLEVAPDQVPLMLEDAMGALEKSQHIVDQLLSYSRKETQRELLDLSRLAAESLEFLGPKLRREKAHVVLENEAELPVWISRTHVHQILTNLVLNALQASGDQPRLRIFTFMEKERAWCTVGVEDWGCGIPEVSRSKVFDPFYTTKDRDQGTGLGLSVSLQLAEQHGGEIDFESKPSGGTVFYLRLPRKNR